MVVWDPLSGSGTSPTTWLLTVFQRTKVLRTLKKSNVDLIILNASRNIILLDQIVRKGVILIDRDRELREEFEVRVLHEAIDFREQRVVMMGV